MISFGNWSPQFTFLALESDPYFNILSMLTGFIVCLVTGNLILLDFMDGETTDQSISTLVAFIGFGFGAGIIRMTYLTTFQLLVYFL